MKLDHYTPADLRRARHSWLDLALLAVAIILLMPLAWKLMTMVHDAFRG